MRPGALHPVLTWLCITDIEPHRTNPTDVVYVITHSPHKATSSSMDTRGLSPNGRMDASHVTRIKLCSQMFKFCLLLLLWVAMFSNQLVNAKKTNHYETLGVPKGATLAEIRRGFRLRSIEYHPDQFHRKPEEIEAKYRDVLVAYEILKNHELRKAYNLAGQSGVLAIQQRLQEKQFRKARREQLQAIIAEQQRLIQTNIDDPRSRNVSGSGTRLNATSSDGEDDARILDAIEINLNTRCEEGLSSPTATARDPMCAYTSTSGRKPSGGVETSQSLHRPIPLVFLDSSVVTQLRRRKFRSFRRSKEPWLVLYYHKWSFSTKLKVTISADEGYLD